MFSFNLELRQQTFPYDVYEFDIADSAVFSVRKSRDEDPMIQNASDGDQDSRRMICGQISSIKRDPTARI